MTLEKNEYTFEKRTVNPLPYVIGLPIAILFLTGIEQSIGFLTLFLHFVYSYGVTHTAVYIGEVKTNGGLNE